MFKPKALLCTLLTIVVVFCSVASTNTELNANMIDENQNNETVLENEKPVQAKTEEMLRVENFNSVLSAKTKVVDEKAKVEDKKAELTDKKKAKEDKKSEAIENEEEMVEEGAKEENEQPEMTPEELALAEVDVCIPVIMYHAIVDNPAAQTEYSVSSAMLENDFIAYKNAGFTPIDMQTYLRLKDAYDAAETAENPDKKLDELRKLLKQYPNPILLTFDDGYKEWYSVLYPLVLKHNVKVNLSMVGIYAEGNSTFLSSAEVQEMAMCDLITFGNHTNLLHEASNTELQASYQDAAKRNSIAMDYLRCNGILMSDTGKKVSFMAYPYGVFSEMTESIVDDMGIRISLATNVSDDLLQLSDSTRMIPRINRVRQIQSDAFIADLITKMEEQNEHAFNTMRELVAKVAADSFAYNTNRSLYLEKDGVVYNLSAKILENEIVLPMQELRKNYPQISVAYSAATRTYTVKLFDKEVIVNYLNGTVSCEDRIMAIPQYATAMLPVRALFEVAGCSVTYDVTGKIYVQAPETKKEADNEIPNETYEKFEIVAEPAKEPKLVTELRAKEKAADVTIQMPVGETEISATEPGV